MRDKMSSIQQSQRFPNTVNSLERILEDCYLLCLTPKGSSQSSLGYAQTMTSSSQVCLKRNISEQRLNSWYCNTELSTGQFSQAFLGWALVEGTKQEKNPYNSACKGLSSHSTLLNLIIICHQCKPYCSLFPFINKLEIFIRAMSDSDNNFLQTACPGFFQLRKYREGQMKPRISHGMTIARGPGNDMPSLRFTQGRKRATVVVCGSCFREKRYIGSDLKSL